MMLDVSNVGGSSTNLFPLIPRVSHPARPRVPDGPQGMQEQRQVSVRRKLCYSGYQSQGHHFFTLESGLRPDQQIRVDIVSEVRHQKTVYSILTPQKWIIPSTLPAKPCMSHLIGLIITTYLNIHSSVYLYSSSP